METFQRYDDHSLLPVRPFPAKNVHQQVDLELSHSFTLIPCSYQIHTHTHALAAHSQTRLIFFARKTHTSPWDCTRALQLRCDFVIQMNGLESCDNTGDVTEQKHPFSHTHIT